MYQRKTLHGRPKPHRYFYAMYTEPYTVLILIQDTKEIN